MGRDALCMARATMSHTASYLWLYHRLLDITNLFLLFMINLKMLPIYRRDSTNGCYMHNAHVCLYGRSE